MKRQLSIIVALGIAAVSVLSAVAAGPRAFRTPWGDPDLQGIWNNGTRTPLERSAEFGNHEFLTDAEYKKISTAFKRDAELRALPESERPTNLPIDLPAFTALDQPPQQTTTGSGPDDWYEGITLTSRRTSLLIEPTNGHLPPLTAEASAARKLVRERTQHPQSWEDFPAWQRCITRGVPGGLIPTAYNNNYQIVQTPGYVVLLMEMIHDARIIPLDGRPPLPGIIKQWDGDSRGHWDGDTLVVTTTNFRKDAPGLPGGPLSERAVVTERLKRVDADTIDYRFSLDDPVTYTSRVTAAIPLIGKGPEVPDQILEYACHEGNRVIFMVLSGAQAERKNASKTNR